MIIQGVIAASGKGAVTVYVYGSNVPALHQSYIETGTHNGVPLYISVDGLFVIYGVPGKGQWQIADASNYGYVYYRDSTGAPFPWEGTNWSDALGGTPVPVVSLTPFVEPSMLVTGAGTADVNQLYLYAGMLNGFKSYTPTGAGDPTLDGIYNDGNGRWLMTANNGGDANRYRSDEDVSTPDLITNWGAIGLGVPPSPTVTAV